MLKKSLIFGSIAVLAALLLITGCSNPTSSSGSSTEEPETPISPPSNNPGGGDPSKDDYLNTTSVSAADLADKFAKYSTVTLGGSVERVEGEVPAGKTLIISGTNTAVRPSSSFAVKGSIEIKDTALLNASYSADAGYLTGSGKIYGLGTVSLPFLKPSVTLPAADGIDSTATTTQVSAKRAVGSIVETTGTPGDPVGPGGIDGLFIALGNEVSVSNITELTTEWDATGRTLTLAGNNTIASNAFTLASGSLVINGTLNVDTQNVDGDITNNGFITSATVTPATQKFLLTQVEGTGTVVLSADTSTVIDTGKVTLKQNVIIAENGVLAASASALQAFDGDKKITIEEGGTLDLGVATNLSGVTITNNTTSTGGIETATTTAAALNTILKMKGLIASSGSITGNDNIEVPAGAFLTHTSGDFVGGSGTLIINGEAEFTTGTFEDQTVRVTIGSTGNAIFTVATFEDLTELVINGTVDFADTATFASLTELNVGETGDATFASVFDALDIPITINGIADFTAATFEVLEDDLTINGTATLGAAAVPLGDVVVGGNGILNIDEGLTIATGSVLNNSGTITLADTKILTLAAPSAIGLAKITGTGEIIAGLTTLTGAWEPTLGTDDADGNVTITASDTTGATIEADGTYAKGLKAGANATITQAAGGSSALTIAASTDIDLSSGGILVLLAPASTPATIAATGTITAGKTEITGNWSTLGTADTDTVRIAGSANGATITKTGADVVKLVGETGGAITQDAGESSALVITGTTVDIATTGTITLTEDAGGAGGLISFTDANSLILVGEPDGVIGGLTTITIDSVAVISGGAFTVDDFQKDSSNNVAQIGGTHSGTIKAGTVAAVVIETGKAIVGST
jgi:hypothetical protein